MTISPMEFLLPVPLTGVEGERGTNWLYRETEDGVVWLIFDKKDAGTNTFDRAVFEELSTLIHKAEEAKPLAIVFRSAKQNGFAAGADLRVFRGLHSAGEARHEIVTAHALINRIAELEPMTIAVVHGHCVGGGLELALACNRIIARRDTVLGFPEVRVGLHPGLGGSARLTHRISPVEAMKMMLSGKSVDAHKAYSLGIVDGVCEERHVANAVNQAIAGEVPHRGGGAGIAAMNLGVSRTAIASRLESETEKRAPRDHYPAPYALIDLWREHGGYERAMLDAEIDSFARLLPTDTAQNLIRVFFLREKLKSLGDADAGAKIAHVHVIGAGTMGAAIGAWCALKGKRVTIEDPNREALGRAVKAAAALFDDRLEGAKRKAAKDRFIPDTRQSGVPRADLVIEAAPEKADLKEDIYRTIEHRLKEGAILATNTSSLPLDELSGALSDPRRFVGLHFFNPVNRLELVEVVRHGESGRATLAAARAFVSSIGRLPAPVRSGPGFLVNRALVPYLMEALAMMDEGIEPELIDWLAERFGMPMGPVEVADQVGLDICLEVAMSLKEGLDRPLPDIPDWLRTKVEKGELGRKSGKGLYLYQNGEPQKKDVEKKDDPALTDRLILPLVDECVTCLAEGVADDEGVIDAAMIFATGFAPFRGGPLHYARRRGTGDVRHALTALEERRGERFRPSSGWSSFS